MEAVYHRPTVIYFEVANDFYSYAGGMYVPNACGNNINHAMVSPRTGRNHAHLRAFACPPKHTTSARISATATTSVSLPACTMDCLCLSTLQVAVGYYYTGNPSDSYWVRPCRRRPQQTASLQCRCHSTQPSCLQLLILSLQLWSVACAFSVYFVLSSWWLTQVVRNTWGGDWGDKGYAYIQMTGTSTGPCGMYQYVYQAPESFTWTLNPSPNPVPSNPGYPGEPGTPDAPGAPRRAPSAPWAPWYVLYYFTYMLIHVAAMHHLSCLLHASSPS